MSHPRITLGSLHAEIAAVRQSIIDHDRLYTERAEAEKEARRLSDEHDKEAVKLALDAVREANTTALEASAEDRGRLHEELQQRFNTVDTRLTELRENQKLQEGTEEGRAETEKKLRDLRDLLTWIVGIGVTIILALLGTLLYHLLTGRPAL